jgi:hypothetical protein
VLVSVVRGALRDSSGPREQGQTWTCRFPSFRARRSLSGSADGSRLEVQDLERPLVRGIRLGVAVSDGGQPEFAVLGESPDQMEQDSRLASMVVVQMVGRGDVDQILRADAISPPSIISSTIPPISGSRPK